LAQALCFWRLSNDMLETSASDVLASMIAAAVAAGDAALPYFRSGHHTVAKVTMKQGNSPVTEADHAANAVLKERLHSAWPRYGWISEEDPDSLDRLTKHRLFVVDPIDGTRAFVDGRTEWCVSIGLIEGTRPIAGVIHLPVLSLTYIAALGEGAFLNGKKLRCSPRDSLMGCRYAGPKATFDHLPEAMKSSISVMPRVPSLAYRMAQAASGQVDLAVATPGGHDWDIAAADIILSESGATLIDETGERLIYNRPSLRREMLFAGPFDLVMLAKL
jgi:myo-inositol-1(or 4)-monophosphatase